MIQKIQSDDAGFPPLLKEIPHPPAALYVRGILDSDRPHIAIVGTRRATATGREIAREFARRFSESGITVVSGLAMGIDTAAHEGAVAAKAPTIAVLASGLDSVYPRQNRSLAEKILKFGGALVSEYEEGTESFPSQFIVRNRIVSGLSLGVVLIEAPERSGALATARFALDQNRDVFVVPGPMRHPNYVGSHRLIQSGAALVSSAEDVLVNLNLKFKKPGEFKDAAIAALTDENEKQVAAAIIQMGRPATAEEVIAATGLEPSAAGRVLTFLVVKGIIREVNGRYSN